MVPKRAEAIRPRANKVVQYTIAADRRGEPEDDAVLHIAGDDITVGGRRATDRIIGRTLIDQNAFFSIAQGGGAVSIGADEVAANQIVGCRRAGKADAAAAETGRD